MDFNKWNPFWTTCFVVMAFLIIVGNSLTIATLLQKQFRKGPHLLLISLAVADLLVGCTIPLYVVATIALSHRPEILFFSRALSLLLMVSSMLHLPVISLERLMQLFGHFVIDSLLGKSTGLPWLRHGSFASSSQFQRWC